MIKSQKKFDPTKPVRTRDGRKATIVDPDYNGKLLTVVSYECGEKGWQIHDPQTGLCLYVTGGQCDLVNVPVKHVKWVNIYKNGWGGLYDSREMADHGAGERVACVRFEYEEGEGLG